MTRGQQRLRATLALFGTIVGAGIFGVPAMIGAWGIPLATAGFVAITGLILGVHMLFADAVASYRPVAHFSRLARYWLGPRAAAIIGAAQTLQVIGSSLAYLLLGGAFLSTLASLVGLSIPLQVWQVLFWLFGIVIVTLGLERMARAEAFLTWMLIALLLLIIGSLFMRADLTALMTAPQGTFEPYGVFLFSLFGMTVIPEMERVVGGNGTDLRKAVLRGSLAAAALTYLFGISAWLASSGTIGRSPEALVALLPPALAVAVPLFGFLAVITSYITTAYDLNAMFRTDYRFAPWTAWLVALGVPLALLFLTDRDFITVTGLVGSVFSASVAVGCVLMGRAALRRMRPATFGQAGWWWQEVAPVVIITILVGGGIAWLLAV